MAGPDVRSILSKQLGIRVEGPEPDGADDESYPADVAGRKQMFVVRRVAAPDADDVGSWQEEVRARGRIPLIFSIRLSGEQRAEMRNRGINHLDAQGRVWIRDEALIVDIERPIRVPRKRKPVSRNPFARKASLVPRVMLAHAKESWGVRELKRESSISQGYASEVLSALEELGYAAKEGDGYRLSDPAGLLAAWSAEYAWNENEVWSFVADYSKHELTTEVERSFSAAGIRYAHTLLSGSDLMAPHVVHENVYLFVAELDASVREVVSEKLFAEPVERGGNLGIAVPRDGEAVFYGARSVSGVPVVSPVQLFLDLVHFPVRGPEAADVLLRRVLAEEIGLSSADVARLKQVIGL